MKLSICIPTYNRAEFLPATLESIAAQWTDEDVAEASATGVAPNFKTPRFCRAGRG